jgi:hypothetical protein
MTAIYAQGDILLETVDDHEPSGWIVPRQLDGAVVIAEGELTGHRHIIYDRVTMFRDDGLAHGVPLELYVGHIRVEDDTALLRHQEHAPIALPRGTYRVRRQRELEPRDARIVAD